MALTSPAHVDGFCKTEGVTCDNPDGQCWNEQDLPDTCVGEVLTGCESFVALENGASAVDEDTSSCSVGGGSSGWMLLLGLLAWTPGPLPSSVVCMRENYDGLSWTPAVVGRPRLGLYEPASRATRGL